MSPTSLAKAKKFLVNRVLDQAKKDNIPLTEIEIRMLGFAEKSASAKDMEAAEAFERDYNDEEYESKVAQLLRRAYRSDKESGKEHAWDEALTDLGEEDMYLLVMINRAGIEGSNPFSHWLDWRFFLGLLPTLTPPAIGLVVAFTSFGAKLVRNENLRLLVLLLLLATPLLLGVCRK